MYATDIIRTGLGLPDHSHRQRRPAPLLARAAPEQRQSLLDAFDRGGQSALAFSKSHGVSYQTFISWLRKRREGGASLPPGVSPFAEVILEQAPPSSSSTLRILRPCGTVIEVASRAALPLAAELLSTLRRPC